MVLFSRKSRGEREAAERIYDACREAARRPALYVAGGVPDTLEGRFEMVALALFPVLNRLMHEPGDDPQLARLVSEVLVEDMDAVFRELGVSDPVVPKRMQTLYRSFAGRITAYRNALAEGDELLAHAVSRNVFPGEPRDGRAAMLARYLRSAVDAVAAADIAALRRGDVLIPEIDSSAWGAPRMTGEPFSFAVSVGQIPTRGKRFRLAPDEGQRRAIAAALGIIDVLELVAELEVAATGAEGYSLRGALNASVVQTDVVTLEPLTLPVNETIDLVLLPADEHPAKGPASLAALDMPEDRDVYRGGRIDLGAIVVEHLALGLDPYPRSPGVEFPGHVEAEPDEKISPFAALSKLKRDPE